MEEPNLRKYLLTSSRGQPKIGYEGYFYNYKETSLGKVIWRCNQRLCTGGLVTNLDLVLKASSNHNHVIDERKYAKVLLLHKVKKASLVSDDKPRHLITRAVSEDPELRNMPFSYNFVRDAATKHRKRSNFTAGENYDIPIEISVTKDGKKFLLYDSGMTDDSRIVILGTNDNIRHLSHNKVWICDGTFKSAPSNFEQLFILQCPVRGKFVPLLYCFMKNRLETTYKTLCNVLVGELGVTAPCNIILDYECASYNAFKAFFKASKMHGCLFHLSQIVWRRIGAIGATNLYKESFDYKLSIKMILSLAFVPQELVNSASNELKEFFNENPNLANLIKLTTLYDWFRVNYLAKTGSNKSIVSWNVYERTLNHIPRTTNSIEGFNRHLNDLVSNKQKSINKIGFELVQEQALTEAYLIDSLYISDKKTKEDKILEVVKKFGTLHIIDYLKSIALNFHFPLNK